MTNELSLSNPPDSSLEKEVKTLQLEINKIADQIDAFETILRSHLINEIIEVQELTVLFKKQKQDKKNKRIAQKKRGKNYTEPLGLKPIIKEIKAENDKADKKEKKRLYREALLHIHPDKFSIEEEKIDLATDLASQLIDIYQKGSLLELQEFHAHIFNQNVLNLDLAALPKTNISQDAYLKKDKLLQKLISLKEKHTYKVLIEYKEPLTFIAELKAYYSDRLFKLRKRTRKG